MQTDSQNASILPGEGEASCVVCNGDLVGVDSLMVPIAEQYGIIYNGGTVLLPLLRVVDFAHFDAAVATGIAAGTIPSEDGLGLSRGESALSPGGVEGFAPGSENDPAQSRVT